MVYYSVELQVERVDEVIFFFPLEFVIPKKGLKE